MTTKLRAASFQDGAVTTAKIAADAITNAKIADGAVDSDAIGSSAIVADKLGIGQISGRRNMVINGAMQVSQRGTSQTNIGNSSGGGYFTLDRFTTAFTTSGIFTMTQTADGPSGFANCLKLDCTTADTSIATGEFFILRHIIEGQDLQRIKKGTSDAEKVTISFYVKGNANATYQLEFKDADNDRINSQAFSVTTSWNRISLTFDADTTGAFDDDNAASVQLNFWLHAGATYTGGTNVSNTWAGSTDANRVGSITSFFDSTDREFFITGLQMEVGEQATPFEHRSFGEEHDLCKRYYQKSFEYATAVGASTQLAGWSTGGPNGATSTGYIEGTVNFEKIMRAIPTMTIYDYSGNSGKCTRLAAGTARYHNSSVSTSNLSSRGLEIISTTGTAAGLVQAHYTADAEL